MDKKKYLYGILGVLVFIGVFVLASSPSLHNGGNYVEDSLDYNSEVCLYKNGEKLGCDDNLLTDDGKDLIKTVLGDSGTGGPVNDIGLCNASAGCTSPESSDSTLDNEFGDCGLSRASGSYSSNGVGNWTISNTFTSSCDGVETNLTGIHNGEGTLFAENDFGKVILYDGDQLDVEWTIWVS